MTPEVIAAYIGLGMTVIGFVIYCGRLVQRVEDNEKIQNAVKQDVKDNKEHTEAIIEKLSEEFAESLKSHVKVDIERDNKVEILKEELQGYVRDQVLHQERLTENRRQTEELKREFGAMKIQVEGIKETTFDIKQDVVKLSTVLEQLVEVSRATQTTVQKILETSMQEKK